MLWLPWLRRVPPSWLRGLMALTVGLLAFLAVDATLEGLELAGEGSQAFGGAALVFVGAGVAYLLLSGVSSWLGAGAGGGRRRRSSPSGSGCTTSARAWPSAPPTRRARSRSARSSSIGFALHNTTEGLAIVAPLARARAVARPAGAAGAARGRARGARRLDRRGRLQRVRWPRSCSASARARSSR